MLVPTIYKVDLDLINEAILSINDNKKIVINNPSDNFFYDPWIIKTEYIGSVWEKILNTLPVNKGEARIIRLNSGESYTSHADADDRYHLNLSGLKSFLIDLDNQQMYSTKLDGIWYEMDAGFRHTAANFGNRIRYQLVIRKLLQRNTLINPKFVRILSNINDLEESRFIFDDIFSTWINRSNKSGIINKFDYRNNIISFNCEGDKIEDLRNICPKELKIEIHENI